MLAPPRSAHPIELGIPDFRASAASSLDHYPMRLEFVASTSLMVAPRRPKLSLDISTSSTFSRPSSLTSPSRYHKSPLAMRPHPSALRSPSPSTAPYVLPLGSKSILRNGPLPRRIASATSARGSRRFFSAPKRVVFCEALTEMVPAPAAESTSAEESDGSSASGSSNDGYAGLHSSMREASGYSSKRRKMSRATRDERGNESHDIPARRPKRTKDWIWTMGAWDDVQLYDSPEEGAPPMDHAASQRHRSAKASEPDEDSKVEATAESTLDSLTTNGTARQPFGHKRTFSSDRGASNTQHNIPPNLDGLNDEK